MWICHFLSPNTSDWILKLWKTISRCASLNGNTNLTLGLFRRIRSLVPSASSFIDYSHNPIFLYSTGKTVRQNFYSLNNCWTEQQHPLRIFCAKKTRVNLALCLGKTIFLETRERLCRGGGTHKEQTTHVFVPLGTLLVPPVSLVACMPPVGSTTSATGSVIAMEVMVMLRESPRLPDCKLSTSVACISTSWLKSKAAPGADAVSENGFNQLVWRIPMIT